MSKKAAAEDSALRRLGQGQVSAKALVEGLRREGYDAETAVRAVVGLQTTRKVTVTEPNPYESVLGYSLSPISLWFWAAVGAVLLSAALTSVTSGFFLYFRYVFGSALILFLPGYALIEALYPKRELDELTRFALSIGLSLAISPLTGLVLNYTPFGIRLLPVTLSLAGVTAALLVAALVRKHQYYKLAKGIV